MAGGIIEVTFPPVLGPHVMDYFYIYTNESGNIDDNGNRFTFMQGKDRIAIMNPCMDCNIELTPIVCNSMMNLTSKNFSVRIMRSKLIIILFLFFPHPFIR